MTPIQEFATVCVVVAVGATIIEVLAIAFAKAVWDRRDGR
jgi:hypothetical protein